MLRRGKTPRIQRFEMQGGVFLGLDMRVPYLIQGLKIWEFQYFQML